MKRFLTLPVDMENMKIFEVVSNALKIGGKHFMDIMNGSYAETHFPCKLWDEGEKCLTLSAFEWDKKSKIMLYGQVDYPYGEPLCKPEMKEGNPIRLYTISEISKIFSTLGMSVCKSYADYTGKPSSDKDILLMVDSVRNYIIIIAAMATQIHKSQYMRLMNYHMKGKKRCY